MNMYPWSGDYKEGDPGSPVAVVTLGQKYTFENAAIWGPMKTENLGIEKVVANVISNPNIRYLIICGKEIRGHRSGKSFLCLAENGIDEDGRIIKAPGAVPYIENLDPEAIQRFREQVEAVDMIDDTDTGRIQEKVDELVKKNPECFGEPYIAIKFKEQTASMEYCTLALHASLDITPWGDVVSVEVK
ncbi:MAG: tetrahydromethanopterin S-methyltransferase subunit A [Thermoplasmata archaeon]